jgi:hypothetical protein
MCVAAVFLAKASHGLPILERIQVIETNRQWFG